MSIIDQFRKWFSATDEEEVAPEPSAWEKSRRGYGLSDDIVPVRKGSNSEAAREPIRQTAQRSGRENIIPTPDHEIVERLTQQFKIVVVEPGSYDESPAFIDDLKSRKPVIINLEAIEDDTAQRIYYYLLGGTYALNGSVQKIAQKIYVFLPENVDVSAKPERGSLSFGKDGENPWK